MRAVMRPFNCLWLCKHRSCCRSFPSCTLPSSACDSAVYSIHTARAIAMLLAARKKDEGSGMMVPIKASRLGLEA